MDFTNEAIRVANLLANVFRPVSQGMAQAYQGLVERFSLLLAHRAPPRELYRRRRYYLKFVAPQKVPPHSISYLTDGFCVNRVANTGLHLIDNFCTPMEAGKLIEEARQNLVKSSVVSNQQSYNSDVRTSDTATIFTGGGGSGAILPLLFRGAMLLGLPYNHVEAVYVSRYREGGRFGPHHDYYSGFQGDRLYTILIYLNNLEEDQGGETVFERLNVTVRPRLGRAVTWTNQNPDRSVHPETMHEALPVKNGGEKWVVQLWFRRYKMFDSAASVPRQVPQASTGRPAGPEDRLPAGADLKLTSAG